MATPKTVQAENQPENTTPGENPDPAPDTKDGPRSTETKVPEGFVETEPVVAYEDLVEGVGEGTGILGKGVPEEQTTVVTPQTNMPTDAVDPGPTAEGTEGKGNL